VVLKSVKRFRQTGNVNIPKRVRMPTVVTESGIAEVSERLGASPQKSLRKHAGAHFTLGETASSGTSSRAVATLPH
jgi:hypothetical protein